RWLDDRSEPWRDKDGKLLGSVGILTDITERKLLENRLRQAQKMEAIGKLAGGIAHDFNNLLTVINGYADLLRNQLEVDTFPHKAASQILSAGASATKLTEHLLAFSRQQLFTPQKLDLNALLERLGQIVQRTIGEDVEFTTILAPEPGMILADPGQIEQVVLNLVSNARDAMPGGGKLSIQTANVDLDETYVRLHPDAHVGQNVMLAVGDTGHGMDAATRARVFEPFFSTKEERTVGKGSGLGLAAVHGIVSQCGGTIDVYSELGLGTTFKVYFPQIDVETPVSGKSNQRDALPRGSETIMVVEDEPKLRLLARLLLEAHGYQVLDAEGGAQAMQAATNHARPIDLVLTDVVMPGLNGPQVAEELTRLFPDLKVVYMSGFTDDMVFRHGVISEGVNFLQKPFTAAGLILKVRDTLDNR
ncbi:MAG TPA: ATP-binding protein, partial [Chloroflexota bacterium]|nr:ATP-binding protein [Chloroflexota bacterium]